MLTRRRFLITGLGGSVALAVAWRLRATASTTEASPRATAAAPLAALDRDAPAILAAVVPVILSGALPTGSDRETAIAETLHGVARAIAGLAPSAQRELGELFSLLGFAPARVLLAGVRSPWNEASPETVAAFLERWRTSRFELQRSAYDALHQLTLSAWYANPRAWPAIGYPGPPRIER
jgi:hypothetical protein